jgi:hypothetical protein
VYGRQDTFIGADSEYLSYLLPVLLGLFILFNPQSTPGSRCSPNADKYGKPLTQHSSHPGVKVLKGAVPANPLTAVKRQLSVLSRHTRTYVEGRIWVVLGSSPGANIRKG